MEPYDLKFDDGPWGWRWFLRNERLGLVAMSYFYSSRKAAVRGFNRFWQRLRKKPIISAQK